jgi:molybdopterin-guanine dinucleotide biosynthesis protein A
VTGAASDTSVRPRSLRLERDACGVVFCGGASRRMGRDKAGLVLDGRTLLERAAGVLAEFAPRVLLASGDRPHYPELGLGCVLDESAGAGPLAGLAAALECLGTAGVDYACVLACDMPRASAAAFRVLLARARDAGADVCLVRTDAGLEPLFGVYHARVLAAVRAALARGERRMTFHGDVRS